MNLLFSLTMALFPLYSMASVKLNDLITTDHWAHTNSTGATFLERVNEYGWHGENLYKGQTCDIRKAIELWEESPTHQDILDHEYNSGVILIERNDDYCYIVMEVKE